MEAAKWSAFLSAGLNPEDPLRLPDELLEALPRNLREPEFRRWSAFRAELLARRGIDQEFLKDSKLRLNELVACIMQTNADQAASFSSKLGRAITAKLVGAGASSGLLGLAAAIGTASTGTAIGSLSGAALTSAQLAWIGGFFGGGMAAGTVLTGGLGLAVGVGAMVLMGKFKVKPRQYKDLSEIERQVIDQCSLITQAIDEELKRPEATSWAIQDKVFRQNFRSLLAVFGENEQKITKTLNRAYKKKLTQEALPAFKRLVIENYSTHSEKLNIPHILYKERAAMIIVTTVLWKLWKQNFSFDTFEEKLVIQALRMSRSDLNNASLSEIGRYVSGLDSEQIRGLASSVKGKYHELLWVTNFNQENTDLVAELHESTTHIGSDVVIRDLRTGEIVREIQLKATESNQYIREHFERYRDIELVATTGVSERHHNVGDSGFKNSDLEAEVHEGMGSIEDFGPFSEAVDSAAAGGLIGLVLYGAVPAEQKKSTRDAGKRALEGAGIAAATTTVVSYLFS
jgi:hypothetical protein